MIRIIVAADFIAFIVIPIVLIFSFSSKKAVSFMGKNIDKKVSNFGNIMWVNCVFLGDGIHSLKALKTARL